jgi:uncharacterized protein (DUF1810 family)
MARVAFRTADQHRLFWETTSSLDLGRMAGLGSSSMAKRYSIGSRAEAEAYLEHPLLGARLRMCVDALLGVEGRLAEQIMGDPNFLDLKLLGLRWLGDASVSQ